MQGARKMISDKYIPGIYLFEHCSGETYQVHLNKVQVWAFNKIKHVLKAVGFESVAIHDLTAIDIQVSARLISIDKEKIIHIVESMCYSRTYSGLRDKYDFSPSKLFESVWKNIKKILHTPWDNIEKIVHNEIMRQFNIASCEYFYENNKRRK